MPLFSWVHKDVYKKLFACLPDPFCMRFVGGAVRNTLLGIPFHDVDFATSYRPEEIVGFFQAHGYKVIPTGIEHGTVTVLCDGASYEITTLRRDVKTDGRHAVIAYTPVWQEDAFRRDFTMNALYVDHLGAIYDDVGGQADVAQGLIRFIGDPAQRIHEDYLRILRFFRFWALYVWQVDPASLEACCQLKEHLSLLSGERITKEMLKMLGAEKPWPMLTLMREKGFDSLVWGLDSHPYAIEALKLLEQHWGKAPLWVRLVGFIGAVPKRLVLSNAEKSHIQMLLKPFEIQDIWASVYAVGIGVTQEKIWMLALNFLRRFLQSSYQSSGLDFPPDPVRGALNDHSGVLPDAVVEQLEVWKKECAALDHQIFPEFSVSGKDVMSFSVSGPDIGRILKETKDWWISQHAQPSRQACLDYARKKADTLRS